MPPVTLDATTHTPGTPTTNSLLVIGEPLLLGFEGGIWKAFRSRFGGCRGRWGWIGCRGISFLLVTCNLKFVDGFIRC